MGSIPGPETSTCNRCSQKKKKKKKRNVALAKYKINRTLNIAYTIKSLHKKGHVDEKQYNIMSESKTLDLDFWNKIPALLLTKCDLGQVS